MTTISRSRNAVNRRCLSLVLLGAALAAGSASADGRANDVLIVEAGQSLDVTRNGRGAPRVAVPGPARLEVINRVSGWVEVRLPGGGTGFVREQGVAPATPVATQEPRLTTKGPKSAPLDGADTKAVGVRRSPGERDSSPVDDERVPPPRDPSPIAKFLDTHGQPSYREPRGARESPPAHSAAFSPDGRYLAVGEDNVRPSSGFNTSHFQAALPNNPVAATRLFDLTTGKEVLRFSGHKGATYVNSISFSRDSRYVCTTGYTSNSELRRFGAPSTDQEEAVIWDLHTGERLFDIPRLVRCAEFSPNGRWLLTIGGRGVLSLYRTSGLEREKELPLAGRSRDQFSLHVQPVFSPTGRSFFAARSGGPSAVWEYETATLKPLRGFSSGSQIAVSNDGRQLAIADRTQIVVWDLSRHAEIRRFEFPNDSRFSRVAFDATDKHLLAANGGLFRWEVQSGRLVSRQTGFNNPLAVAPSREVFACKSEKGAVDLVDVESGLAFLRYTPFHRERASRVEAINGVVQETGQPRRATNREAGEEAPRHAVIDLRRPRTPVTAPAANPSTPESLAGLLETVRFAAPSPAAGADEPTRRRRILVLGLGVGNHKHKEYDLAFARRDAEQVVHFFVGQDKRLYDVIVKSYLDRQATSQNLRRGLAWLKDSCRRGDIALIFLSGHGVKGRNGLYFMPHEGDAQGIQHTCVNWSEIADAVHRFRAGNTLMLVDCCHAGDFGLANRPTQQEMMRAFQSKPGLMLYCSSQPNQLSIESREKRHGVFTYAVLEALRGEADTNNDGLVTLGELKSKVDELVDSVSRGKQLPYLPHRPDIDWDMPLAVVSNP